MTETIEINETMDENTEQVAKPYTFRKLSSEDMFLMFKIIKKIGIKEFKDLFAGDNLEKMVGAVKTSDGNDKALTAIGVTIGFDVLDVILGNLPNCEKEIYKLLAQVSGMDEADIKADMILFTEMIVDFVKKDEFPAFIKVVSKLFK